MEETNDGATEIHRRKALKAIGASTGLGIVSAGFTGSSEAKTESVSVINDVDKENVRKGEYPWAEISVSVSGLNDAVHVGGHQPLPTIIPSEQMISVPSYSRTSVPDFSQPGSLILSDIGLNQSNGFHRYDPAQILTSAENSLPIAVTACNKEVSLRLNNRKLLLETNNKSTTIEQGESKSLDAEANITYVSKSGHSKQVMTRISLEAINHGVMEFVGHPDQMLVPKETPGGRKLQNIMKTDVARTRKDSQPVELHDYSEVNVIGVSQNNSSSKGDH